MIRLIYAVDFDGTLCENRWPEIGAPNHKLITYLIEQKKSTGARIILWTCRVGSMLDDAVKWCSNYGLTFDAINENLPEIVNSFGTDTRKIFANYYIDDRNYWYNEPSPQKTLYICDKRKCRSCSHECIYTTDIKHAKHFTEEHGIYYEED